MLDPVDKNQTRQPFDVKYVEMSEGSVVYGRVICTSSNFKNDTFNFKFTDSGEIRTVHSQLLLKINEMEVML